MLTHGLGVPREYRPPVRHRVYANSRCGRNQVTREYRPCKSEETRNARSLHRRSRPPRRGQRLGDPLLGAEPAPRRAAAPHGRRCYDPAIVARLRRIAAARHAGLGIGEIRALLAAAQSRAELDAAFAAALARVDRRIATLERLRVGLADLAACACLDPLRCDRGSALAGLG